MKISERPDNLWVKLMRHTVSIYFLPALPFYKLAYWVIGKRCVYRWGEADVRPIGGRLTKNEYLFTRVFPMLVLLVGFVVLWIASWILGKPIPFKF